MSSSWQNVANPNRVLEFWRDIDHKGWGTCKRAQQKLVVQGTCPHAILGPRGTAVALSGPRNVGDGACRAEEAFHRGSLVVEVARLTRYASLHASGCKLWETWI